MAEPQAPHSSRFQWLPNSLLNPVAIFLVVLVVALIYVSQQDSVPQYVELFDGYQPTKPEINRIMIAFSQSDLDGYQVVEDRIHVPTSEKAKYLSAVHDSHAVPSVLQNEKSIDANIFLSRSQQQALRQDHKKRQIRDMILLLPFVREAWLELDWSDSNYYQQNKGSAIVMVRLSNGQAITRQQVNTIKGIVGGAFSDIPTSQIVVADANMGISYNDLDDSSQSELIEFVSWRMQRRIHYSERLAGLLNEFPGLRIEVEVRKPKRLSNKPDTEKIAKKIPTKFAIHETRMKLNTNGVARIPTERLPQVAYSNNDHNATSTASYRTPAADNANQSLEVVDVFLKVPAELANATRNTPLNSQDKSERKNGFDTLKSQLTARVRSTFPELGDTDQLNVLISVIENPGTKRQEQSNAISSAIQMYWPIVAALAIGLIGIVVSRRPSPDMVVSPRSNEQHLDPQELETQLTTLIDKDPEAAAKVIKNWIRDAG